MSSNRRSFRSSVIAYASIHSSHPKLAKEKFRALTKYCLQIPIDMDYLAEEYPPNSVNRLVWNELLEQIEIGLVKTIILPNLYHAYGDKIKETEAFLRILRIHNVRLKTVEEGFDTKRQPSCLILKKYAVTIGTQ